MHNTLHTHRRTSAASIMVTLLIVLVGCGASDTSDEAADSQASSSVDDAPVEAPAATETATEMETEAGTQLDASADAPPDLSFLDPAVQDLIEFEASWQCDLARFAVEELSDIDLLLAERRAEFAVTDTSYAEFQERLALDPELRALVAEQTSSCVEAGEPVQL